MINKSVYFVLMAKTRLTQRNQAVKDYFTLIAKKYPQWRLDALEEEVADKFYIEPRTVRAIIKEEGCYAMANAV